VTADPDLAMSREFGFDRCLPKPVTAALAEELAQRWRGADRPPLRAAPSSQRDGGPEHDLQRRVVPRFDGPRMAD